MFVSERTANNMKEKQFNLLEESWIKVLTNDMKEKEVSLLDLFAHAHEYRQLAGETAMQDAAIFRFLLAILATVFYRYNVDGTDSLLSDPDDVIERWREYREQGHFSEEVFRSYLESWSERFWLFHPETPFYQVADLEYGTDYDSAKCLYGNIKESKNDDHTRHHFSVVEGQSLEQMTYSEATRWLIHFMAYAIRVKPAKNSPDPFNSDVGIGRMGCLGYIMVRENTVFDMMLLNLCPLKYGGDDIWGKPSPTWERPVCKQQTRKVAIPNNIPEAYTIQSRRLLLKRNDRNMVCGFKVLGGDYYERKNEFNEQMTIWDSNTGDETNQTEILPKVHDPNKHIWQEFATMFYNPKNQPGLLRWIDLLQENDLLNSNGIITIQAIGAIYDSNQKFNIVNSVNDQLSLSTDLLSELGEGWRQRISDEIAKCENVADAIRKLCDEIGDVLYGKDPNKKDANKNQLVQRFYSTLDKSFRDWLLSIQPIEDDDYKRRKKDDWKQVARAVGKQVAEDYISSLGNAIYRIKGNDKKDEKGSGSILDIYNKYLIKLASIYPK